jgi:hypothetical protein
MWRNGRPGETSSAPLASRLPRMLVDAVEAMDRGNQAVQQTASWIGREMAVAAEKVTARTWMPLADVHRRISDVLDVVAGAGAVLRALGPALPEYARRALHMVDAAAKLILDPGYSDKAERLVFATRRAERKGRAFSAQEEGARLAGIRAFNGNLPQLAENPLREFAA